MLLLALPQGAESPACQKMPPVLPKMPPRCSDFSLGSGSWILSPDPAWAGVRGMFPHGFGVKFHGQMGWDGVNPSRTPREYSPLPLSPLHPPRAGTRLGEPLGMLGSHPASSWALLPIPDLFQAQLSLKTPEPNPNPCPAMSQSQFQHPKFQQSLEAELGSIQVLLQIPGNPPLAAPGDASHTWLPLIPWKIQEKLMSRSTK